MSFSDLCARIGRLGLACAIICLSAVPLSGCGGGATPTPELVAITFAYTGSSDEADYYERLIREFNEHYPYITVELVAPGAGDADIFVEVPFALNDLQEGGDILSLDPFIEQDPSFDLSDYYPGTVELFTIEGRTWAVPAGVDIIVMYYNQDLFDQYDVPHPEIGWTWDDFLYRALALRDPEAGVFGYVPVDPFLDATAFIYLHGGRIFDDMTNPTRTTFDDPLTIEAVEWYVGLMDVHNVAPTARQMSGEPFQGSAQTGVYANKVGMWSGWLSDRGGQNEVRAAWPVEWNMRWGMVPLPSDVQAGALTIAMGYFISSEAQHPDACWQWISFLNGHMPHRQIPARKSLAESTSFEQLVGADVAAVVRASMESAVLPSPDLLAEFEQAVGIFGRALEAVTQGRATPEEALTRAQRQAEQ